MPRVAWVLLPLLAQWPVWSQTPAWHAGVAKVTMRADLNRQPATAFVVSLEEGKAFLVTSAHVVEGDPNPQIEFVAAPRKQYQSTVRHVEAGEIHGLALLEVGDPPASVRVLQPSPRPALGQRVTAGGFPAPFGTFTVKNTEVSTFRGRELVLGDETGEGFSGGPVVSEDGNAVGLVFGRDSGHGLAVQSADIRTYVEGQGLTWASQQQPVAGSAKPAAPSERNAGEVRTNPGDGQNYVWIPPGEFQMGCSPGDNECYKNEKPPHMVAITHGFWLGQTEVTQAAYQNAIGNNPSKVKSPDHPVDSISWDEARVYCETAGGRLPTEAEWEYAARAGSEQSQYGELDAIAWYASNSGGHSHPVGKKEKNAWGLYDMIGNVMELVADWWDENYYQTLPSRAVDPKGPAAGRSHVNRGSSFGAVPKFARVSIRDAIAPGYATNAAFGFRCARDVIP